MKEFSRTGVFGASLVRAGQYLTSRKNLPRILVAAASITIFTGTQCVSAQDPTSKETQVQSKPLEEFRAADRAVLEAYTAYEKAVAAEEQTLDADKKRRFGLGRELRFLGGGIKQKDFTQLSFFLNASGAPELDQFPALKAARSEVIKALEQRAELYRTRLPSVFEAFVTNAANACRDQRGAQQVAVSLASLADFEELERQQDFEMQMGNRMNDALRYLRTFKTFIAAEISGDPVALGPSLRALEFMHLPAEAAVQMKPFEDYRNRLVKSIRSQGESELGTILTAFPKVETVESLNPLIAKVQSLAEIEEALTERAAGKWNQSFSSVLYFLKRWSSVLSTESDERSEESVKVLEDLKASMRDDYPRLAALAEKRLELNSKKARKAGAAKVESFTKRLAQSLSGVSTPDELKDLIDELIAFIRNLGDQRDPQVEWLGNLRRDLQNCASAWQVADTDPRFAQQLVERMMPTHPWSKEVARVRDTVLRRIVVSQTGLTELEKPPLSEISLADALQKSISAAAASSSWERVYELLAIRTSVFPKLSDPQELVAMKAFLAGLNYERAELFVDAAKSYREVLKNVSPRVPTKEAAERLKALKTKYPELAK